MRNFLFLLLLIVQHNRQPLTSVVKGDDNKIVGGRIAYGDEFPFVASLQHRESHICGGTLITPWHLLTAGHCVIDNEGMINGRYPLKRAIELSVLAGTVNIAFSHVDYGVRRDAVKLRKHPKCRKPKTGWTYDFGLVTVNKAFKRVSNRIEFYPLPHYGKINSVMQIQKNDTKCLGVGWGSTAEKTYQYSSYLMRVELTVKTQEFCEERLSDAAIHAKSALRFKKHTQLCTYNEASKDACQGDSGGPLLCGDEDDLTLYAIVSWGIGCGRQGVPGVWARLDIAEDWIRQAIAAASSDLPEVFVLMTSLVVGNKINFSGLS